MKELYKICSKWFCDWKRNKFCT